MTTFGAHAIATLERARAAIASLLFLPNQPVDHTFSDSELGQLHACTATASTPSIDGQTWGDLLIDRFMAMLSAGVSVFGQQLLYCRLRAGLDDEDCAFHAARIQALLADPDQLHRLDAACQPLRGAGIEVASLLFGPRQPVSRPGWTRWIRLVGPLFLAAVAAAFVSAWAWAVLGLAFALLLAIRLRYIARIEQWQLATASLQRLLAVCSALGASTAPLAAPLQPWRARAGRLHRGLSRSPLLAHFPVAKDYLDWFLLANIVHYFKSVQLVDAHLAELRSIYLLVAKLEADIALARHLRTTEVFCWAGRHAGLDVVFDQVVNPLLDRAMPLSVALAGKGAFISGQNGIGKSTLLRTLGLNLVAARAFGFCYAHGASVSIRTVHASMHNQDAMLGGESLYIAELRRAREMLASLEQGDGGIYLIDEIFRGTNHLESVAAATAVLEELAGKGRVIVSSHNLVLAQLLAGCLQPLHVSKSAGALPRLTLLPGVLVQTNGLSLLAERGFDTRVQARAGEVFDWLGGYLADPAAAGEARAAIA